MRKCTKHAEGPIRNVSFSDRKLELYAAKEYWRKQIALKIGSPIDTTGMEDDEKTGCIAPIHLKCNAALRKKLIIIKKTINQINIVEYKEHAKNTRREYIFDLRSSSVPLNIDEKKNKRIIKSIKNTELKRSSYKYLSHEVGKGKKDSLTSLRKVNVDGETTKIVYEKQELEETLTNFNIAHYQ